MSHQTNFIFEVIDSCFADFTVLSYQLSRLEAIDCGVASVGVRFSRGWTRQFELS